MATAWAPLDSSSSTESLPASAMASGNINGHLQAAAGGSASSSRPTLQATGSSSTSNGKTGVGTKAGGGGAGGASDFVKKLYRMLEDPAFGHIVSWGRNGDSFVVKDMNDFTKLILPRHFKHSNFASFVRQLNKYDFHKVKNPEDGQTGYGEHVRCEGLA